MSKRRITVTIDEATFKALNLGNKNVSGYINELLQEKVVGTLKQQLTAKMGAEIKDALMADEVFFNELARRLQDRRRNDPLADIEI